MGDGKTGYSAGWTAMTSDQVAAATEAFSIWAELADIQLVADPNQSTADITLAYSNKLGSASEGNTSSTLTPADTTGGDATNTITHEAIWLSANSANLTTPLALGGDGFTVNLHEIGHALGLSHPGAYDVSDSPPPTYDSSAVFSKDTRQYSIMSYFGGETLDGWTTADQGGLLYSSTPQLYDIAAIQQKYGANFTTRNGDTTYGYNSNAGWNFFDFTTNTLPVFTIWDGGGNDTIDASLYTGFSRQTIDLAPGAYSSVLGLTDNIAIAFDPATTYGSAEDALIENAIGGDGEDTLRGNYGDNRLVGNGGNDLLYGMAGADTLVGGDGDDLLDGGGIGNIPAYAGVDVLTGGAGDDTFVYKTGYNATTITDFSIADDVLDLTGETKVADLAGLLSYARQDGADLVFDFGASGASRDVLRLQNVTYRAFAAINPLSVEVTQTTASAGIRITPNPSTGLSPMYVSVAPLAGGGFVATRFSFADSINHQILAFRYDATGTLIDSVQVNTAPSDAVMVRAVGLGSGRTLVVWDSPAGGEDGSHAILGRLLDPTGTPIGDVFQINRTKFVGYPAGSSFDISLLPTPDGGADLEWRADSLEPVHVPVYYEYRTIILPDGSVGTNLVTGDADYVIGTDYGYSHGGNVYFSFGYGDYVYSVQTGTDGLYHAYYANVVTNSGPVQLDDGDFVPDSLGVSQPPFQVIQLTDGRILFSYLSGLFQPEGYQDYVLADKVVILTPDGTGFTKPGTDGNDYLQGGPGNDQLYGKNGDDVLMGMGGGDLLDGGAGTDTAAYTRSPSGVIVDLRVAGPQGGDGDAAGDTLVSIENLVGSAFADELNGDAGANQIEGGAGNDTIDGNGGSDMLFGGAGDDTIVLTADVAFGGPALMADGGDGNDSITINGDNAFAYGDDGDDTIVINGNNNTVNGGDGTNIFIVASGSGNRLYGGPGHDIFRGGPGDDVFDGGGGGHDTYAPSAGHDVYSGSQGDVILYNGNLADYAVSYDPDSGTLMISDMRPGAPDGVAIVNGIDGFRFQDGIRTLAQLLAVPSSPSVAGQVVDGYVAGATVFADVNGNFRQDPGEAATVTDALGRFTLSAGMSRLVATGGTDIATGLALPIPLTAPSGYSVITAVSTLVDAVGGAQPEQKVLAALNLDTALDLKTADPVANPGNDDPYALFVADTMLMDMFVVISAFVASVRDTTVSAAFGSVLAAFTGAINDGAQFHFGSPDVVADLLNRSLSGTSVDQAELADVRSAIVASNLAAYAVSASAGADPRRLETAVAITAQGGLAGALTDADSPADIHAISLAYTGANLDAAVARNLDNVGTLDSVPCYCPGTRILTPAGERPVETLAAGDLVVTHAGHVRPVRWAGHLRIDFARHPSPAQAQPVRILAHAFADGVPSRDLRLSPDHAVLFDGALIQARQLVNGASVVVETGCGAVTYHHVELDTHDILLAEGLPAESYLDTGNRTLFANIGVATVLHQGVPGGPGRAAASCLPLTLDPTRAEAAWRTLADRATSLGLTPPASAGTTDDPALHVVADGSMIRPASKAGGRYVFVLPRTEAPVRLVSRAAAPSDTRPWLDDRRRLGVKVRGLMLQDGAFMKTIEIDDKALSEGWWDAEPGTCGLERLTNGDAVLSTGCRRPAVLEVILAGAMQYPLHVEGLRNAQATENIRGAA